MQVNRNELVAMISEDMGVSKSEADKFLTSFMNRVISSVADGAKVSLVGFGSWSTSFRAERTGRNPSTGEEITIPASTVAKFKVGSKFKDEVNKEK